MLSVALVAGIEGLASFVTIYFKNSNNSIHIVALSSVISLIFVYLIKWRHFVLDKSLRTGGAVWKVILDWSKVNK